MSETGSGEIAANVSRKQVVNNDLDLKTLAARIRINRDHKRKIGELSDRKVVEVVQRNLLQEREAILRLPSDEEGLNMDRVHAFRESIGIPRKAIRILTPQDYTKVNNIIGEEAEEAGIIEDGIYLARHDVIVVRRDPELESLNGSEYIESLLVHEIAHSKLYKALRADVSINRRFMRKGNLSIPSSSLHVLRGGFAVRTGKEGKLEGSFLEEGYAELERGRYIVQALGKEDGFGVRIQSIKPSLFDKYTFLERKKTGEAGITAMEGAIPAMTLELLIKQDPELLNALRKSSVQGLREVARRINAVSPGLYQGLRKVDIKSLRGEKDALKMFKKVRVLLNAKGAETQPDGNSPS